VSIACFIATQYQTGAAMIRDTRSVERLFTLELRRAVLLAVAVPLVAAPLSGAPLPSAPPPALRELPSARVLLRIDWLSAMFP